MINCGSAIQSSTAPTCSSRKFCTDLEVVRDDVGRGQDDEAEPRQQQQQQHQVAVQQQPSEIEERSGDEELTRHKQRRQSAAGNQQPRDQAVMHPVQPVALIKPGIEQSKSQPSRTLGLASPGCASA